MNKKEIEEGLSSLDLETRKRFAESEDMFDSLSEYQIERGLTDDKPIIRYIFAKKCLTKENISNKQVLRGLSDKNTSVRALFVKYSKWVMSGEYIENILKDKSTELLVSLALATRANRTSDLTIGQKRVFINSPVKRVRDAFPLVNPNIEYALMNRMIRDSNVALRKLCASSNRLFISKTNRYYYLERGLLDQDRNVRRDFSNRMRHKSSNVKLLCISYYQLERGLADVDVKTREEFSNNRYHIYTEKQVTKILKDDNIRIRISLINNTKISLTNEHIIKILKDDIYKVVASFLDNINPWELTSEQIEMGLTSKHDDIRRRLAEKDIDLSNEQIKRGLNDDDELTVAAFISRDDSLIFLDQKKIKELLKKGSSIITIALIERDDIRFTNEQIEDMLIDSDEDVRECVVSYLDTFTPTRGQVNRGIVDESSEVRLAFARRRDIGLNEDQVNICINDSDEDVVRAILERNDITLTTEQIKRVSGHTDYFVGNTLRGRRDYIKYEENKNKNSTKPNFNRV